MRWIRKTNRAVSLPPVAGKDWINPPRRAVPAYTFATRRGAQMVPHPLPNVFSTVGGAMWGTRHMNGAGYAPTSGDIEIPYSPYGVPMGDCPPLPPCGPMQTQKGKLCFGPLAPVWPDMLGDANLEYNFKASLTDTSTWAWVAAAAAAVILLLKK